MTTAKKNFKIFILQGGNMTKGEYGKGYYGNIKYDLRLLKLRLTLVLFLLVEYSFS